MTLSLITVNVGAPSLDRAQRQLRWLAARSEEVLALTETKATAGSQFLAEAFITAGYAVTFPEHAPGELGVMIVSKLRTTLDPLGAALDYLPARAAGVVVDTTDRHGLLDLFRHLHPDRVEHSWARRAGLGYRYDHAHGSRALTGVLTGCEYVHETRELMADGNRLTDHSGLAVRLALTATGALLTSDPVTAATPAEPEPTLF